MADALEWVRLVATIAIFPIGSAVLYRIGTGRWPFSN